MVIEGMHYSQNCLCESCKQAGNRRYIGGGVYNINDNNMKTLEQLKLEARKEFDKQFAIGIGRKWIMTKEEAGEVKDFINSLITKAYEEALKEFEKIFELTPSIKLKDFIDSLITKAYEDALKEITQIIKNMPTEFPERESDSFDQGAKYFKDNLLKKIR